MSVNKARFLINGLALAALLVSLFVRNDYISVTAILLCLVCALAVLFFNLPALTNVSQNNPKLKTVRLVTLCDIIIVVALVIFCFLLDKGKISVTETQLKYILSGFIALLIIGFGNIAPKLPFNRHTGLRLPWTVRDEDTWIVAHRVLGYISLPLGLLCLAGAGMKMPLEQWAKVWIVGPLLLWIGIPALLSGIFYVKKWKG